MRANSRSCGTAGNIASCAALILAASLTFAQEPAVAADGLVQVPDQECSMRLVVRDLQRGRVPRDFQAYFDRDPERDVPGDANILVSPADGVVHSIWKSASTTVVRISMTLIDVHVQRVPISGTVVSVDRAGATFLRADEDGHLMNVQNVTSIETEIGRVVVKQITGFLARRIKTYVKPGQSVHRGDRLGRILLGSTVVLIVPDSVEVTVAPGQEVIGGETVVGRYVSPQACVEGPP